MDENAKLKLKLRQRILTLRRYGIKKVHVAFSGYGDEGEINTIIFEPELNDSIRFNQNSFHALMYDFLNPARVGDWINNDGGFGAIVIDVETGKIEGTISFRETTVSTESFLDKI